MKMKVRSPTSLQPQIAAMRVTPQGKAAILLATTVAVAAVVVKAVQIMSLTAVMMINQWKRGKRKVVETWLTFWKDKNCSLCCVTDRIMELGHHRDQCFQVDLSTEDTAFIISKNTNSFPCSRYVSRHAISRNTRASGHETNNSRFGD